MPAGAPRAARTRSSSHGGSRRRSARPSRAARRHRRGRDSPSCCSTCSRCLRRPSARISLGGHDSATARRADAPAARRAARSSRRCGARAAARARRRAPTRSGRLRAHVEQTRLTAETASLVCSVENTRWPVIAAWIAISPFPGRGFRRRAGRPGPGAAPTAGSRANVKPDLLVHLHLVDAASSRYSTGSSTVMIFVVGRVDVIERGVERRRLAAARRTRRRAPCPCCARPAP